MATLVEKCLINREPVLLVGETGCGKTTICQLMSIMYQVPFYSINCHHYTESMDFLGSLRPVRNKEELLKNFAKQQEILQSICQEINTKESNEIIEIIQKDNNSQK